MLSCSRIPYPHTLAAALGLALLGAAAVHPALRKVQQKLWSKTGLAGGSHTVEIVKASGSVMILDAFNYQRNQSECGPGR